MPDLIYSAILAAALVIGGYVWAAFRGQRKQLNLAHESQARQQKLEVTEKANAQESKVDRIPDADVTQRLRDDWTR
jgi:uncharacterized protein HemX